MIITQSQSCSIINVVGNPPFLSCQLPRKMDSTPSFLLQLSPLQTDQASLSRVCTQQVVSADQTVTYLEMLSCGWMLQLCRKGRSVGLNTSAEKPVRITFISSRREAGLSHIPRALSGVIYSQVLGTVDPIGWSQVCDVGDSIGQEGGLHREFLSWCPLLLGPPESVRVMAGLR